jgi:hypothetical protein
LSQFFLAEIPPFAYGEIQLNVHDSNPLELRDLVAQVSAHAADLPIQALFEDNPKLKLVDCYDGAGIGYGIQDGNAGTHPLYETGMKWLVYSDHILLFVVVF